MKELQSYTSIVILTDDKGISIVIPNREDYLEKSMDNINNGSYKLLKKDPTAKIKAKILKKFKALKGNEFIKNKSYYCLKPNYQIIFMANILKAYVKNENNNAKNCTTFSNYIRNVLIEDDEIMVSLDVTSLYTNIPTVDMLNIINDYVNNDHQFSTETPIPQDKFLDLINLVLTIWYTLILSFINKLIALE